MSNLHFVMNPYCPIHVSYGRNLLHATRDFLLAVLGVRVSSQALVAVAEVDRAGKVGEVGLEQVHRLADSYDSISPNLSSELRMMARSAA
jgi:hypothetical protein